MPRPIDVPFGIHLRNWRTDRGLSQEELAELLDVSSFTIHNWEKGTEPRNLDEVEDKLRLLQTQKGESATPTRNEVRALWN